MRRELRLPAVLDYREPASWVAALLVVCVVTGAWLILLSRPAHKLVTVADGKAAWLVTCSDPGDCVEECARTCPAGFAVLSQDAQRGSVTTYISVDTGNGSSVPIPTTSQTYSGATVIRCMRAP